MFHLSISRVLLVKIPGDFSTRFLTSAGENHLIDSTCHSSFTNSQISLSILRVYHWQKKLCCQKWRTFFHSVNFSPHKPISSSVSLYILSSYVSPWSTVPATADHHIPGLLLFKNPLCASNTSPWLFVIHKHDTLYNSSDCISLRGLYQIISSSSFTIILSSCIINYFTNFQISHLHKEDNILHSIPYLYQLPIVLYHRLKQ